MPTVSCGVCSREFYAKPSWLSKGNGKYCSRACSYSGRKNGKVITCDVCGKQIYKQQKAILSSKSKKLFCSKKCSLKWHNSEFIESNHANWKFGTFAYKRILQRAGIKEKCILCSKIDLRILVVHHLDKNRKNNKVNNLVWACRNCHHLIHNYAYLKKV
jgi:hypothetical protein